MGNTQLFVAPVVAGVLAWFLSGDWVLGASLLISLLAYDKIKDYYKG